MFDVAVRKRIEKQWCGKGELSWGESRRKKYLDGDNGSITGLLTWIMYSRDSLRWIVLLIPFSHLCWLAQRASQGSWKKKECYMKTRFYFISTSQDLMEVPAYTSLIAHIWVNFERKNSCYLRKFILLKRRKNELNDLKANFSRSLSLHS